MRSLHNLRAAAVCVGVIVLFGCAPHAAHNGIVAGITVSCARDADSDGDALPDDCELALARAFAPELRVSKGGCNWDTSVQPERPGGEYYFAAQPRDSNIVRLAYLIAYYRDCGWSGPKCSIGVMNCSGHSGDSELIAIDIERTFAQQWHTVGIFLSAHCFGHSAANCRWYREQDLARFQWVNHTRGAPVVWVAQGKHANYTSRTACDRGHWFYDTCDDNRNSLRYPLASHRQNIGSQKHPAGGADGCVDARAAGWASAAANVQMRECLWSASQSFTGWQRPALGAATPYGRYLRDVLRFW